MVGLTGQMADIACAVACAIAMAVCAWLMLGWERREIASMLASGRALMEREVRLVALLARNAARRLGLSALEEGVSLGDVSELVDIVRLGLSAGLSFDAALGLYYDGRSGALAERMARARLSWQAGISTREDELLAAARDLGVRELESFAMAVGQAIELGAPLADTLLGQGREIRAAHRAEVERQIERAPVKLLIPTGTLILPALLLSILGPLLAAGGMI